MVDGAEKIDKSSQLDEAMSNNVINVKKSDFEVFEALAMDLASNQQCNNNNNNNNNTKSTSTALSGSPPGSYSQNIPVFDSNSNAGPPILPPHLLQAILNKSTNFGEPILLPQPNHVMLNHLYALSIKVSVCLEDLFSFLITNPSLSTTTTRTESWC